MQRVLCIPLMILGLAACLIALGANARAGDDPAPATPEAAAFEKPELLHAGEKTMGEGRLYPSPVFQDLDGDGSPEMVIGDLPGRLTFATRESETGTWGAEQPLMAANGKPLKFHNW